MLPKEIIEILKREEKNTKGMLCYSNILNKGNSDDYELLSISYENDRRIFRIAILDKTKKKKDNLISIGYQLNSGYYDCQITKANSRFFENLKSLRNLRKNKEYPFAKIGEDFYYIHKNLSFRIRTAFENSFEFNLTENSLCNILNEYYIIKDKNAADFYKYLMSRNCNIIAVSANVINVKRHYDSELRQKNKQITYLNNTIENVKQQIEKIETSKEIAINFEKLIRENPGIDNIYNCYQLKKELK